MEKHVITYDDGSWAKSNLAKIMSPTGPKFEKKKNIGGAIGGNFSRSESESFVDAVTEFADTVTTGSATKTLHRDLFFPFKDAENGVIAAALTWVMGQRYSETAKIMPAGVVAGISGVMTAFYLYKFATGGNHFSAKKE